MQSLICTDGTTEGLTLSLYDVTTSRRLAEAKTSHSQQTENICNITFIQCWANVEDIGPTLYKFYINVLCLLGCRLLAPGGGGGGFHTCEYWVCAAGQGAFLSFQLWHRVSFLGFQNLNRVLFLAILWAPA